MSDIMHGDCIDVMRTMDADSIDAIVTDPPYGLSFMGKHWDHGVPGVAFWDAALRVAKPGTYLLAFGGTRTYHRMTCAIEDAGWEIHDCLTWLYGSGFPKHKSKLKPAWEPIVMARKPAPKATPLNIDACRLETTDGYTENRVTQGINTARTSYAPAAARRTFEPASGRWPANVVIDEDAAAAIDAQSGNLSVCGGPKKTTHNTGMFGIGQPGTVYPDTGGASRFYYCAKASRSEREAGLDGFPRRVVHDEPNSRRAGTQSPHGGAGRTGATRNNHPTVKPVALMRWLVRLVAPPDGIVLDPFTGSGTTGIAATLEGRRFVGIEREAEYVEIARARIAHAQPALGVA